MSGVNGGGTKRYSIVKKTEDPKKRISEYLITLKIKVLILDFFTDVFFAFFKLKREN